jgi:ribokinase
VNETFCGQDIADALPAFQCAKKNSGLLALSLEMPLPTVITAIKQANEIGLRTVLDPGGIRHDLDAKDLLAQELYLIKPNEHEAHILTGIKVSDQNSALEAAKILRASGAKNVLLTMGGAGAYLLAENASTGVLLPIPQLKSKRDNNCDETGCGDQTMAALCAALLAGCDLLSATKQAMLAGTLQFFRLGIIPVTREELDLEADEMLSGTHL